MKKMKPYPYPPNATSPIIEILFSYLTLFDKGGVDGLSGFKSICPVCDFGILLVGRDQKTLLLEDYDCCIACGQHFFYSDMKYFRLMELTARQSIITVIHQLGITLNPHNCLSDRKSTIEHCKIFVSHKDVMLCLMGIDPDLDKELDWILKT